MSWNVGSFKEWWDCNKDSEYLREEYREAVLELKQMGEKVCSFKNWAREHHKALKTQ
jgi:hypothetical protein